MQFNCPGRDARNLTADDMVCPHCGASVELFSDEQRRRCPVCGKGVTREAVPSCAAWCASALECLGAERLEEMRRSGALDTGEDVVAPREDAANSGVATATPGVGTPKDADG